MPDQLARPRTAEEAIAQAETKYAIRSAQTLVGGGLALVIGGVSGLLRYWTWRPSSQILAVHIHGGPTFTLSLQAIVSILAIVAGPVVSLVGHLRFKRALRKAAQSPITAAVVNEAIDVPVDPVNDTLSTFR